MITSAFDEIAALGDMRVQEIYGLFNSVLVMELFSPRQKRLYLVFDQDPSVKTLHVQRNRPVGLRSRSPFILLLNKYLHHRWISDILIADNREAIKFVVGDDYMSIIFDIGSKPSASLFDGSILIASSKPPGLYPSREWKRLQEMPFGLEANTSEAKDYESRSKIHYEKLVFNDRMSQLKKDLTKKIKLLHNVRSDLERCQKQIEGQGDAELLKANLHLIKPGMRDIEVVDYTAIPPKNKVIALDPKFSPRDLLAIMFKKIKRAKRGVEFISERIASISDEIGEIQKKIETLLAVGVGEIEAGDLREPLLSKKEGKKTPKVRKPFKSYRSSDGITILVGRSARESDDMSLHYAKGNDWWLHAQDAKGAHVVVKFNEAPLPPATLLEAGMLALHFSSNRMTGQGEVRYTRAKNIKKPKGLPPGKVLIFQEKSLLIDMEKKKLEAVLATEE